MKNRILVKLEDFLSYKNKFDTDKLDEENIIWTTSKSKLISKLFPINEEIFNGIETKYDVSKNKSGDFLINFNSISSTKYRFDLLKEPNTDIYHLGFSLSDTIKDEYEKLTDKGESLDVFNRLIWILKDINRKFGLSKFFIGATENEKKNKIYQYMMRNISNWEKRSSAQYDKGWGIYFEL